MTKRTRKIEALANNQYFEINRFTDEDNSFYDNYYFQSYETGIFNYVEHGNSENIEKHLYVNACYHNSRTTNKYYKQALRKLFNEETTEEIYKRTSKSKGENELFQIGSITVMVMVKF